MFSLDNFLLKNVIVFFFLEIRFQNGANLKKGGNLTYFLRFKSLGKRAYLTYIHVFCSPYWPFLPSLFLRKLGIHYISCLFDVICIPAIFDQSIDNKMVSKIYVGMCTIYLQFYMYAKFIDICKSQTLNDGR